MASSTALLHLQRKQRDYSDSLIASNSRLSSLIASESAAGAAREVSVRASAAAAQVTYDAYLYAAERGRTELATACAEVSMLEQRALAAREALGGIFAAQESSARLAARSRALTSQLTAATAAYNRLLEKGVHATEELVSLRATRERQACDRAALTRRAAAAAAARAAHLAAAERALRAHDGAVLAATQIQREVQEGRATLEVELEREECDAAAAASAAVREPLAPFIGELTPEEEAAIAARLRTAAADEARLKVEGRALTSALAAAEEDLSRLARETGLASVGEALAVWSENEASNFSLYNALIEQTREMQKLEEEVAGLLREGATYGPRLWEVLRELRPAAAAALAGAGAPPRHQHAAHHALLHDAQSNMSTVVQSLRQVSGVEAREGTAARAAAEAAAAAAAAAAAEAALRAAGEGLAAMLEACGSCGDSDLLEGAAWLLPSGGGGAPLGRRAVLDTLALVERRTGALLRAYATLVEAAEREKGGAGGRALRILGVHPPTAAPCAGGGGPRPRRAGAAVLTLPCVHAASAAGDDGDEAFKKKSSRGAR